MIQVLVLKNVIHFAPLLFVQQVVLRLMLVIMVVGKALVEVCVILLVQQGVYLTVRVLVVIVVVVLVLIVVVVGVRVTVTQFVPINVVQVVEQGVLLLQE